MRRVEKEAVRLLRDECCAFCVYFWAVPIFSMNAPPRPGRCCYRVPFDNKYPVQPTDWCAYFCRHMPKPAPKP
jgi:hypothetical protein